jgi:hypothetical protein
MSLLCLVDYGYVCKPSKIVLFTKISKTVRVQECEKVSICASNVS